MKEEQKTYTKETPNKNPKRTITQAFTELGRVPPQAIDFEEAVIGAIMLEQDALGSVIDIIKPEFFYKDSHARIMAAVFRLFKESKPVDLLTVTEELKKSGELDMIGGPYYLTQLTNRIASAANVEHHARIIVQKHILRELISISSKIQKDAFEDSIDVFDLLDHSQQLLFDVSENNIRRSHEKMGDLIQKAIMQIELAKDKKDGLNGVPSGFTGLDRITSGWQKSDLIILAARPGMGKSAFVLSMAKHIAVNHGIGAAFFSLEMPAIQLITRLIASESELPIENLRKGQLSDHEWQQLQSKIVGLTDAPLFIDDTASLSIFELKAKCRRLKSQHDIQIVFVDYLQLMSTSGDNKGNREQEISTISRSLKGMAKELDIPVIAISQLSRAVETRGGSKRPMLSDLRESGAIEQDADMVIFIYRPEYYNLAAENPDDNFKGMAEIIIAKHRNGALADVKLRFVDKLAKFSDIESNDMEYNSNIDPKTNYDAPATSTIKLPSKMNEDSEEEDSLNKPDSNDDVPF